MINSYIGNLINSYLIFQLKTTSLRGLEEKEEEGNMLNRHSVPEPLFTHIIIYCKMDSSIKK